MLQVPSPGRVAVLGLDRPTAAERQGVEEKVTVSCRARDPGRGDPPPPPGVRGRPEPGGSTTTAPSTRPRCASSPRPARRRSRRPSRGPSSSARRPAPTGPGRRSSSTASAGGARQLPGDPPDPAGEGGGPAAGDPLHQASTATGCAAPTRSTAATPGWSTSPPPARARSGKLYQGSVWIDRQLYARLRTRGRADRPRGGGPLERGDACTTRPSTRHGQPAAVVGRDSFVLPLRLVAQQILSVVNATTVVERETRLTDVRINGPGFEEARKQVDASDVTMVRDTEKGLRYLVKDEPGRARGQGGVRHQQAVPGRRRVLRRRPGLPAAARRHQLLLLRLQGDGQAGQRLLRRRPAASAASPSRACSAAASTLGANVFALAVPVTDTLFRADEETRPQDVKQLPATFSLKLGHPHRQLLQGRAPSTSSSPSTTARRTTRRRTSSCRATTSRIRWRSRPQLLPLGLPALRFRQLQPALEVGLLGPAGQPGLEPRTRRTSCAGRRGRARTGTCPGSRRSALEVDYAGGSDLDRFSKYQFGFFGGTRVHGYQSNRVRADRGLRRPRLPTASRSARPSASRRSPTRPGPRTRTAGLKNELLGGVGIAGHVHRPLADGGQPGRGHAGRRPGRRVRALPGVPEAVQVAPPRLPLTSSRGPGSAPAGPSGRPRSPPLSARRTASPGGTRAGSRALRRLPRCGGRRRSRRRSPRLSSSRVGALRIAMRHRIGGALLDGAPGRLVAVVDGHALGGERQVDDRLGERQLPLGRAEPVEGVPGGEGLRRAPGDRRARRPRWRSGSSGGPRRAGPRRRRACGRASRSRRPDRSRAATCGGRRSG